MSAVEIILLVLLVVILLVLVVFIVLFLKRKDRSNQNVDSKDISLLEERIKNNINENLLKYEDQINKQNEKMNEKMNDFILKSQNQISDFNQTFNNSMNDRLKDMNERLDAKLGEGFKTNIENLNKVNESLGRITEAQKNLDSLQKEVVNLNNVLSNSQQRGRFGEVTLELILKEVFGETKNIYAFQYTIPNVKVKKKKNGEEDITPKPDAVIFLNDESNRILCIDSKFPFADYQKLFYSESEDDIKESKKKFKSAIRSKINEIKNKYIIENITCEYAIMFIPNDGIYSYIQTDLELYEAVVEYARDNSVVLASPSVLQPLLSSLLSIMINYELTKNIKEIVINIKNLGKETDSFCNKWEKFSKNVDEATKLKNDFSKEVSKIHNNLKAIETTAINENILSIENNEETNIEIEEAD